MSLGINRRSSILKTTSSLELQYPCEQNLLQLLQVPAVESSNFMEDERTITRKLWTTIKKNTA